MKELIKKNIGKRWFPFHIAFSIIIALLFASTGNDSEAAIIGFPVCVAFYWGVLLLIFKVREMIYAE